MKIVIASEFRPGYDVGLESAYARAFSALGHEVVPLSLALDLRMRSPLNRPELFFRIRQQQADLDAAVRAAAPDLVVMVKGFGLMRETVRGWQRDGIPTTNIFPDNPFEAAAQGPGAAEVLKLFDATDVVFVPDRFSAGQLRRRGVRAEFLAFARDPGAHSFDPEAPVDRDAPPIVFVGNPDEERVRYLRAIADLGLRVYGTWAWAKLSDDDPLSRCVAGGVQLGSEMVSRMRSAKLSINVLRQSQKTAHNMRTFEIPACGVCCVSEASVCVEELMEAGRETVVFRSPEELREQTIALLANPARIDDIAQAGFERVRDDTYERRANDVLACLGLG